MAEVVKTGAEAELDVANDVVEVVEHVVLVRVVVLE